jgi:hypothetical protein
MGSGAVLYMPGVIKVGETMQKLTVGIYTHTDSILLISKPKEYRLNTTDNSGSMVKSSDLYSGGAGFEFHPRNISRGTSHGFLQSQAF